MWRLLRRGINQEREIKEVNTLFTIHFLHDLVSVLVKCLVCSEVV